MAAASRSSTPGIDSTASAVRRRDFLGRSVAAILGGVLLGRARRAEAAIATSPFVGEVRIFAGNYAPGGWSFCNGQLMPISQNTALFSLLGTAYGGDGVSTFALPDLRGRVPLHPGSGPGLTNRTRGEKNGEEAHLLTLAELPSHTHTGRASSANGAADSPVGRVMAREVAAIPAYAATADVDLAAAAIAPSGGNTPHNNLQPYLAVSYIIAREGVFPPRP